MSNRLIAGDCRAIMPNEGPFDLLFRRSGESGMTPPRTDYGTIVADPPWTFRTRSEKGNGRSAVQHYRLMDLPAIKALPVASWAARDSFLLLWATDPMLPQALDVMAAWGFSFRTVAFYWAKTTKTGKWHCGCGYYTRANPEQILLGVRGRPKRLAKNVRRLIVAPVREHSRKPDEAYESTERLCAGPYLDLFGRTRRAGWDVLGDQPDRFAQKRKAA